jgi:hypothetical protein
VNEITSSAVTYFRMRLQSSGGSREFEVRFILSESDCRVELYKLVSRVVGEEWEVLKGLFKKVEGRYICLLGIR